MTDKTQPTAHAEIAAPISADLRRIDDAGAKSAPITLMTEDRACTWAWDQVQQDVGTKGWTAGDSCNFYGFFLWGWNYRGQYETQRYAAPPAPAAAAVLTTQQIIDRFDFLEGAVTESTYRRIVETAESIQRAALATAPAQAVAVPEGVSVDAWRKGARFALEAVSKVDSICWLTDSMKEICIKQAAEAVIAERDRITAAPAQEHATQLAGQGGTADAHAAWSAFEKLESDRGAAEPQSNLVRDYLMRAARVGIYRAAAPAQAQEDAPDPVRALIATHAEMLEDNAYAYFELAYTRQTGWMAWITDKPLYGAPVVNPDRKVLANGQGDTPDEACADAARAAQGGAA